MFYDDYLKNLTGCPFCEFKDRMLASNKSAYLTYSKAPYHKHHLLVTPKRHIVSFFNLSVKERQDIDKLIKIGTKILQKLKYDNFTILVKEGDAANKSIPHIHYHLIPSDPIGDLNHIGEPRMLLSKREITILSKQVSLLLKSLKN